MSAFGICKESSVRRTANFLDDLRHDPMGKKYLSQSLQSVSFRCDPPRKRYASITRVPTTCVVGREAHRAIFKFFAEDCTVRPPCDRWRVFSRVSLPHAASRSVRVFVNDAAAP